MSVKKLEKHIELLSKIGLKIPQYWFPIYLNEDEEKIMEESPYYIHHLQSIDNNAFSIDLAEQVYSIRQTLLNYNLG